MKMSQVRAHTADGSVVLTSRALAFEPTSDKGVETVLTTIQLPNSGTDGDQRVFSAQVPFRLQSEASRNGKNRHRIMLKVSSNYVAVDPDVANTGVVASQVDSSRSGGEISVHLVVAMPKAMADDLKGNNGSTLQRCANAQLVTVLQMLGSISRLNAIPGFQDQYGASVPATLDPIDFINCRDLSKAQTAVASLSEGAPFTLDFWESDNPNPDEQGNGAYVQLGEVAGSAVTGIDARTAAVGIATDPSHFVMRGLNNLTPLKSDSEVNILKASMATWPTGD